MLQMRSRTRQMIKPDLFGSDWSILAIVEEPAMNVGGTVFRERTYAALQNLTTGLIYIEEYDPYAVNFIKIKEERLWNDIVMFLLDEKILTFGINKEMQVSSDYELYMARRINDAK